MGKEDKVEGNITEVKPSVVKKETKSVIFPRCVMCGSFAAVVERNSTDEPLCSYCNEVNNIILEVRK
jgi:hypothetical protein